jgi:hypothetical protein
MGDPTSSYATAGIAFRVSGALKHHHHDKVETPSMGALSQLSKNSNFVSELESRISAVITVYCVTTHR